MTVVVLGGGPAGLAAALELRRLDTHDVVVLEREVEAGGIPRHAHHQGFGLRDLRRPLSGPAYARRYTRLAAEAGVEVRTETMVTRWSPGGPLELTGPGGREAIEPDALILATGCRERPRSARLVPGSRPEGVVTTGTLQQLVYLKRRSLGERALIVGAEHVSFSAIVTLGHAGARVVGMTTELPRHQTLALFRAGAALRWRVPVWTRTQVAAIHGRPRVEEAELTDLDTGASRTVECDTVVFTGDWIPDHELAVMAGLEMDPGTRGPSVDAALRTSRPGVFAAGNLLHGAEPADVAAVSGRHAAAGAAEFVRRSAWPENRLPIECDSPLHWIAPNAIATAAAPDLLGAARGLPAADRPRAARGLPVRADPPRGRFLLRSHEFAQGPRVEVVQDGRVLWAGRVRQLVPGRSARLPAGWTAAVRPDGGPVRVRLAARG